MLYYFYSILQNNQNHNIFLESIRPWGKRNTNRGIFFMENDVESSYYLSDGQDTC